VRIDQGKIVEAGLIGGKKLTYDGQTLVEAGLRIESATVQFKPDVSAADVHGAGKLEVVAGAARELALNGQALSHGKGAILQDGKWHVEIPSPGSLANLEPALSTDPAAVYQAYVGFRPTPTAVPPWNPVLVRWKTALPADARVEYALAESETWLRNIKPDLVTEHRMVLTRLSPGATYRIRIRSTSDDGHTAEAELTYQCPGQKAE
jgi:hypothetical protein